MWKLCGCLCFWDVVAEINIFGVLENFACLRPNGVTCIEITSPCGEINFENLVGFLLYNTMAYICLFSFSGAACFCGFSPAVKHPQHTFLCLLKSFSVSVGYTVFLCCVCVPSTLRCRSCMSLFYNESCVCIGLQISLLVLFPALCRIFFCRLQSVFRCDINPGGFVFCFFFLYLVEDEE